MDELTRDEADSFVHRFVRAWVDEDARGAAVLFTEDYVYRWDPFEDPVVGRESIREYWIREGALQSELDVRWKDPLLRGRSIAFEIWATMRYAGTELSDPSSSTVAGAEPRALTVALSYVADFALDGLCKQMREYRSMSEGRRPAPADYPNRMSGAGAPD